MNHLFSQKVVKNVRHRSQRSKKTSADVSFCPTNRSKLKDEMRKPANPQTGRNLSWTFFLINDQNRSALSVLQTHSGAYVSHNAPEQRLSFFKHGQPGSIYELWLAEVKSTWAMNFRLLTWWLMLAAVSACTHRWRTPAYVMVM